MIIFLMAISHIYLHLIFTFVYKDKKQEIKPYIIIYSRCIHRQWGDVSISLYSNENMKIFYITSTIYGISKIYLQNRIFNKNKEKE